MRYVLRAYTMWVQGIDYGYEVEELECPLPDEVFVEHMPGGAVMTAQVSMMKIAVLEPTMKFSGHNPDMLARLLSAPGQTLTYTFRAASVDHLDGTTRPEVIIYEGKLAAPSPDAWAREDKMGLGFTIKDVRYFRMEVGGRTLHEVGLMPARMVVDGIDRLSAINEALGR